MKFIYATLKEAAPIVSATHDGKGLLVNSWAKNTVLFTPSGFEYGWWVVGNRRRCAVHVEGCVPIAAGGWPRFSGSPTLKVRAKERRENFNLLDPLFIRVSREYVGK